MESSNACPTWEGVMVSVPPVHVCYASGVFPNKEHLLGKPYV